MMKDQKRTHEGDFSSRFLFREGLPEDDRQLCELVRSVSMPGGISLTADYDPSFFDAIEIEGHERNVIVVEADRRIVGVALISKRSVFFNGRTADIGYISNLRIDESVRGSAIIKEANRFLEKWKDGNFDVPLYLCAVLQDNIKARKALEGGRLTLFESREIGVLYNAAIPLFKRRPPKGPDGVQVVPGGVVGAEKIAEFLNRIGRQKQFAPVYTTEDIESVSGILRGLGLDDFHIAVKGDHILGVIACWNQLPFRRMMVTGYSGHLRRLTSFLKPAVKLLSLPSIPDAGESVRNLFAACIAIEKNDDEIFDLLLGTILHRHYKSGETFLTVGLMEGDPLLPALKKYLHFPVRTCIYAMFWNGLGSSERIDRRLPHVEAGGL